MTWREFLQVKTLSPARPDEGYAKTRAFWLACGFRPLEELPTLWDADNPALQLIKTVHTEARRASRGMDMRMRTGLVTVHRGRRHGGCGFHTIPPPGTVAAAVPRCDLRRGDRHGRT